MSWKLAAGAIIFAGFATLIPSVSAQDNCSHPRIISVTGNAEIKVAPDEAALSLGVDSHDKDLAMAKGDNDKRIKKLLNLVHSAGVDPKNVQTSALIMGPEYSDEKIPKLLGYQVSQTVTATLTDFSKYDGLMTGSLKAGVNRVDGINFFVSDAKKYRDEARLQALRAAREKAKAMAAELGQTIGKPWEVIEDADVYPQGLTANSNIRYNMAVQQNQATVAGGEVTINVLVRVSFQLE
jgi:uncharacterized protein YggE